MAKAYKPTQGHTSQDKAKTTPQQIGTTTTTKTS